MLEKIFINVLMSLVIISSLITLFLTQASSPDYTALFYNMALPTFIIHLILVALAFFYAKKNEKIMIIVFVVIASFGIFEMGLRVL